MKSPISLPKSGDVKNDLIAGLSGMLFVLTSRRILLDQLRKESQSRKL
jgi:hypothetical protein